MRISSRELTDSMTPGCEKLLNAVCSSIASTLTTIPCASDVGIVLNSAGNRSGGSSWMISIEARLSHTLVICRWTATQMSSRRGPAGRERRVVSGGRAVMALYSSLRA